MSMPFTIKEPLPGTSFTGNKNTIDRIIEALAKRNGMCPCTILNDKDHLCQCLEYRTSGICICGLYVKE